MPRFLAVSFLCLRDCNRRKQWTARLHKHLGLANSMELRGEYNTRQGAPAPDLSSCGWLPVFLSMSALKHISLSQCTAANDLPGLVSQLLAG